MVRLIIKALTVFKDLTGRNDGRWLTALVGRPQIVAPSRPADRLDPSSADDLVADSWPQIVARPVIELVDAEPFQPSADHSSRSEGLPLGAQQIAGHDWLGPTEPLGLRGLTYWPTVKLLIYYPYKECTFMKLLLASLILLAYTHANSANIVDSAKYKATQEAKAGCTQGYSEACYTASYNEMKYYENLAEAEKYMVKGCNLHYEKACHNWNMATGHQR